ncbi:alpha/beta hydrolase [Actinobacillus suis]|uniref:Alpha/beta hydrolase domain-containing protein n=2 Tax=Actinobacillus suis TaxID=716 RepID=K0G7K4_ACTSU|nr:alpha/beta hydrolase [Actinobacillus suis]AFU19689.1 alpha/beta hydrolase domain-containing protein [Actinobacillus suis H91-0380]AIJ31827.1 alpha/beta hydrolase domain-containing protein [Actinobacillus suis ATCC 33415]MCO4166234.1 alpha/beta hydrolase [Actinobacillus suis]MCO4169540.1 alpha/beta hydrolase [Actinobacillus suis]MCQ9629295.1 alpha/beta hydrolase [Actinobacillus suis]
MKVKYLATAFALVLSIAATAAEQPRTAHLLAAEYQDLTALSAVKIDPKMMHSKEGLDQINAAFLKAANEDKVQPDAKFTAPAQGKQPAVDLYVYRPDNGKNAKLPVVYFIHGGGYLIGNARQNNASLLELANLNNVAVVSLEYRLATQAPFPADIDDAYHGLSYVLNNADKFNIDPNKAIIMGESAGGGLAARLGLKVRDKGEFKLKGQVLIYPMLDYRTGSENSLYKSPNTGEFVWTAEFNRIGWQTLKGEQTISEQQIPYYSAATAKNLAGLPRTYMMVGDMDLFVNEDLDYANRLVQAGVKTDLQVISGVYHAFELMNPTSPQTEAYKAGRTDAIHRMLNE